MLNGAQVIAVQLQGGLGNQLFQYAAARRLALKLGVPLALDLGFYRAHNHRTYELGQFHIEARIATAWETAYWRVQRRLTTITQPLGLAPRIVAERSFEFDSSILDLPDRAYLTGYWQSYRYFADVATNIRREFVVRAPLSEPDRALLDHMGRCDAICLHVRRGDYVSNSEVRQFHGLCSLDYYHRAVHELAARLGRPELFVFSDDMPWVRRHLGFPLPTTHVEHHDSSRAPLELRLMSGCQHFVIANSSLSWWAAWLSGYENSIVYAPRQWFTDPAINTVDLTPPTWHRI